MRGVIMETKNGRAVLLTKSGEFVNIKDKNYSVGDKVNITSSTGRLYAMAASLVIVCAGIGSYFTPAGYVSVDINPSLIMTVNIYNKVIDVKSLNDDARVLLNEVDVKGKSAEDSVKMLIEASEDIGYINDNNRSVILDVVPGITEPNIENVKYNNIDITKETADMETLRTAQNIGVSVAKAKTLEEYTEKNGGDINSNAAKFNDKSVKELRNIMLDDGNLSDKTSNDIPLQTSKPQEVKPDNASESPKTQEDSGPQYNTNNNSFPIGEFKSKENTSPTNKSVQNEDTLPENIQVEDKSREIPPETNNLPHWDITQISQPLHIEPKPNETEHEDNKPSDNGQQITEQKPQDSIPNNSIQSDGQKPDANKPSDKQSQAEQKPNASEQGNDKHQSNSQPSVPKREETQSQNNTQPSEPNRNDSLVPKPDVNASSEKQQQTEKKPNASEQGNDKHQSNSQPSVPKREEKPSKNNSQQSEPNRNDSLAPKPDVNASSDKQQQTEKKPNASEQGNDKHQSDSQPSVPKHEETPPKNNSQQSELKQNNIPSQAGQKPSENAPAKENPIRQESVPQSSEPNRNDASASKVQPSEPKPQNDGGNNKANEGMGGHKREMP